MHATHRVCKTPRCTLSQQRVVEHNVATPPNFLMQAGRSATQNRYAPAPQAYHRALCICMTVTNCAAATLRVVFSSQHTIPPPAGGLRKTTTKDSLRRCGDQHAHAQAAVLSLLRPKQTTWPCTTKPSSPPEVSRRQLLPDDARLADGLPHDPRPFQYLREQLQSAVSDVVERQSSLQVEGNVPFFRQSIPMRGGRNRFRLPASSLHASVISCLRLLTINTKRQAPTPCRDILDWPNHEKTAMNQTNTTVSISVVPFLYRRESSNTRNEERRSGCAGQCTCRIKCDLSVPRA